MYICFHVSYEVLRSNFKSKNVLFCKNHVKVNLRQHQFFKNQEAQKNCVILIEKSISKLLKL